LDLRTPEFHLVLIRRQRDPLTQPSPPFRGRGGKKKGARVIELRARGKIGMQERYPAGA